MNSIAGGFAPQDWVRLIHDRQTFGVYEGTIVRGSRSLARVRFPSGLREIPLEQLELQPQAPEEPIELLRRGDFSEPARLRQVLAHIRITGRLADVIYSMEATNTVFHAHQYKPVLKMLASPTGNVVVADEVGLGKTIEAGLIWTELRARYEYRRLLVICPKVLCDKWELELRSKFGFDARIMAPADLLKALQNKSAWSTGFAAICGLQGIRPPRAWEDDDAPTANRASAHLARFLDENSAGEPQFDMVVIDEAHHLRNPDTQSNLIGRLLRPLTQHLVFLTATPIHLRNRDLFSLLSLADPETFRHESALEEILAANAPLIATREALLTGRPVEDVVALATEAAQASLLADTQQIHGILRDLSDTTKSLDRPRRAQLASRIEQANLLANVVNRTRRRDVEELRIIRKVSVHRSEMTELERQVYDAIALEVQEFALQSDVPPGFFLANTLRLLTSCLSAAIDHWRAGLIADDAADDADEFDEDDDRVSDNDVRPLFSRLARIAARAPGRDVLEAEDTKFKKLVSLLETHFARHPDEKVIVFSSFRPTIHSLERRLTKAGMSCVKIHGQVGDRTGIVELFRTSPDLRILLSSEVGSEGIDLQFARTVINYDLPWNPMRVEQRIGRVDRLGQLAESVTIVNLLHRHTVDEKIYDRLYHRLRLCERALGGFEAVLGEEIKRLTPQILAGRLSDAELEERLNQTGQALENRLKIEEELEQEAAALIAHGDQVLKSIHAARDQHRWIGAADLMSYLREGLASLFPGSEVRALDAAEECEIRLSSDARRDFAGWLEANRLPRGRFFRDHNPVMCRIGRPTAGGGRGRPREAVTQTHPLVRFVASRLAETDAPKLRPAIAARLQRKNLRDPSSVAPGRYLIAAQYWRFGGMIDQELIGYSGLRLDDQELVEDDVAEALMIAAAAHGRIWPGAGESLDVSMIASLCDEILLERLSGRFNDEAALRRAEREDRAVIQERTLESRLHDERARLRELITRQERRAIGGGPEASKAQTALRMNKGKLRQLEERAEERRAAIRNAMYQTEQSEQLAVAVVEVEG